LDRRVLKDAEYHSSVGQDQAATAVEHTAGEFTHVSHDSEVARTVASGNI
jgi:hypothetical protein